MAGVAFKARGRLVAFNAKGSKGSGARRAAGRLPSLRYFAPWIAPRKPGGLGRYATAIRSAWRGVSGVYVIREAKGRKRVLYVGESHTGSLGDTCTRHLRVWSGETCSFRTDRAGVVVALVRTAASGARAMEKRLIAALKPRHNGKGVGCEAVPF